MSGVRLTGIGKRFGTEAAVRDVDIDIAPGEFVSLLGPSGCGKSTTLRIIAGLTKPDSGQVHLAGRDVTALPVRERQVGMVFQSLALFPHMSVSRNVAFGLRMRRLPAAEIGRRVAAVLDMVRLSNMAEKLPAQLSGGQQQRVALARALVIEPRVLLLDEPLSALDRNLREEMQGEIRRITRQIDVTSVFVTHDQQEAFALSDRIAVMNAGRIEQYDTPRGLFTRPRTAFVAAFTGVGNLFGARRGKGARDAVLDFGAAVTVKDDLPDGEFRIGLRPEQVCLSPAATTAPRHAIAGRVGKVVYLGTSVEVEVAPEQAPDTHFTVRMPATSWPGGGDGPSPGEPVWLSWDEAAALVFVN
jgi:spermidine/putrescine transport system ATP-binding protein